MTNESTCAVHDVVMGSFMADIKKLEAGQQELKLLIQENHKDTIESRNLCMTNMQVTMDKIYTRFSREVSDLRTKHDAQYLSLNDRVNSLNLKLAIGVGGAAAAGGIIAFLLQAAGLAVKVIH